MINSKKVLAIVLVFIQIITFSACSNDDGSGYIFKMHIDENPRSLDPQTASDYSALLLIENNYLGLMQELPDGSIVNGVAESYTVSDDGLIYTFKLKKNLKWYTRKKKKDDEDFYPPLTAADFVFAFSRLFNPDTNAPYAKDFYFIKGGEEIHQKKTDDYSQLGVTALDDYTVQFTLNKKNPQFILQLTTSPTMPCNEEIFLKSEGRYGLSAYTTPSNGPFYLYSWDYDKYSDNNNIIMRKNIFYDEMDKVYPYGLNFLIGEADYKLSDFLNETTDCYIASGETAASLKEEGFPNQEYINSIWGFAFNTSSPLFKSSALRKALALATNRISYHQKLEGYTLAEAIIPYEVTMGNKTYRDIVGKRLAPEYDLHNAISQFQLSGIKGKDMQNITLIMPEDKEMLYIVGVVMQEWQKNFGLYCNIEQLSDQELNDRLNTGDYDFALTKITADFNSPSSYLSVFKSDSSKNFTGFNNSQFDEIYNKAMQADDMDSSAELYKQAETVILSDGVFIPLFFQSEYFFTSKDASDIEYNPFNYTIYFKNSKKK